MPWTATKSDTYVRLSTATQGYDLLTPTEARDLAADLVQAADEVEPEPEQSCFTCAHNQAHERNGRVTHTCDQADTEPEVWIYIEESGAEYTPDGMPEDRGIQCPCWSAKVTT